MGVRSLIERAARNRVIRRRLPDRFGRRPLYVSPDAALRWLKPGAGAFETLLLDLAEALVTPGDVVWDIGANVGAFAFPAAHRSGATVLAVEADPFLARLLGRSAAHADNRDLPVQVLCAAVGDHNGVALFRIAGRGRAANGLDVGDVSSQHGTSRAVATVPLLSLDTLLDDVAAPNIVKIDVEGAELFVLAGAQKLLHDIRPTILIEVIDTTWPATRDMLTTAGYALYDAERPLDERAPAGDQPCNVLAVPLPG